VSQNLLRLIPTDPLWIPSLVQQSICIERVRSLVTDALDVRSMTYANVTFVDAGQNFQAIFCPSCHAEIELSWWQPAMGSASVARFARLDIETPCCGFPSTLNDLRYHWPQGFARWVVEATGPGRRVLTEREVSQLEHAVEHELRQIWTRH
jgi:hypothetical protein